MKDKDLAAAPQITPLIKTSVKGGLKAALDAMRFSSDDQEITSFLKKYDSIPNDDRERVSWEAIAIAAKINPKHLLGAIQLAVQNHCWNRSRFIAVSNHPAITKARVKYGKMANGEKDRTALDIQNGFLASPKGPTFIGKQVAVFGAGGANSKMSTQESDDGDSGSIIDHTTDIEDRLFGSEGLDEKLIKVRQRLLEG